VERNIFVPGPFANFDCVALEILLACFVLQYKKLRETYDIVFDTVKLWIRLIGLDAVVFV